MGVDEKSFKELYKMLSYQRRRNLKADFCKHFGLTIFSFRKRIEGNVEISEVERLWAVAYVKKELENLAVA